MALSGSAERVRPGLPAVDVQTVVLNTEAPHVPAGTPVGVYTLTNASGMEVRIATYGGIVLSIRVPDRNGERADVTLGFDTVDGYVAGAGPYFGALIGRYGNRIAGGRFSLDGRAYTLAANNGPHHLHGGERGFDKVIWSAEPFQSGPDVGVVLRYTSPDGEEGYPGALAAVVTYTLTGSGALVVAYEATTDAPTPVNLTQHTYFNLTGDASRDILGHRLTVRADAFVQVGAGLIPTGEIRPVGGTPFDFRQARAIGERVGDRDEQLAAAGGYDHTFVLNPDGAETYGGSLRFAARLADPESGRTMDVFTTEPGLQFYSGNFLNGSLTGKGGVAHAHRTGLALETQHFADSPNQPTFPSTVLRPGQTYRSQTAFVFGIE